MQAAIEARVGTKTLWAGRVISALPVALLAFSAVLKFLKPPSVLQGFVGHYGYNANLLFTLGALELGCAIVYAIPRTAVLGAILMTGYLGGATASNVRVGDPSWIMTVLLGVLAWLGLFLRDQRLRALLPTRRLRE